ncbi:MAG: sigma-70 family RNA polymerase sigma factor [Verrucomicrobiota bacterium]
MPENPENSPAPSPGAPSSPAHMVEHFFRHETARLHGALTRLLGTQNLALVEDVAQEALLKALRTWAIGGMPANPSAWITRVAMNLARDAVRHERMALGKESGIITHFEQTLRRSPTEEHNEIRDDRLRLLFVCCHPVLAPDAQVVLALRVLCGFGISEIARAFLSSESAIEKQLTRTKQRIRTAGIGFEIPEGEDVSPRLEGALSALYLLFNEGYKASAGDRLLREELCEEAVRLTALLTEHPVGKTPQSEALLALMLLTSARFPSRLDAHGALLRLEDQDRSKWNRALIARGLFHLAQAAQGSELTEYHIQAGIAACHCTAADSASTDWPRILRLYDDLYRIKPSPVVALNHAIAVARVHGPQAGLDAINAIAQLDRLESHHLLHAVRGELHWQMNRHQAAAGNFRRALQLAAVGPEQIHLTQMLERSSQAFALMEPVI